MLQSGNHQVEAYDHAEAEAAVRGKLPDVLLYFVPESDGPAQLRALRGADPDGGMYVISVIGVEHHPRLLSSMVAAGSHDLLRMPYCAEELLVRANVQARLRSWMSAHAAGGTKARDPQGIRDSRVLKFLGDVVTDDLETMLGRPLQLTESRPASLGTRTRLAMIPMTLASEQVELCISIVTDVEARKWIGANVLGDPDVTDDVLDDVLREMVNIAGGAVKRAILPEGIVLSTGLPIDGQEPIEYSSSTRSWRIALEDSVALTVIAEVRSRANRRIPASGLSEGMVVVGDLHSQTGTLLLPAGTRLTATTAERLGRLLDEFLVEVSAAA
ncbi:MAG TPA: hypothetical protein VGM88_31810 [Kofleriaceae bacterium]